MQRASSQSGGLQNNDRVAIVGGGPAGSFFAIHLLREARSLNRHLDVVIVEKRGPTDQGADDFQCKGCNFCAGLVSPRRQQSSPAPINDQSFCVIWKTGWNE